MLSAIAARKAAQRAPQEISNQPDGKIAGHSLPAEVAAEANPRPKRKSSSRTPRPAKRKKRTPERYFTDSFKEQDDVIVIDSEDEEMASSDNRELLPTVRSRRGRSPNRPLDDSSGEDEVISFTIPSAVPSIAKVDTPELLSNFVPVSGKSLHFLNSASVAALDLPSDSGGTIIVLEPVQTICLLGTYTFCVLQGSITVCGTPISATLRRHRVFALRSSPLPILEGVDGIGVAAGLNKLPQPLQSMIGSPGALVLLQELRTGVEGLGRICPTFDGLFEPSRWQKQVAASPLQLPGVHLITHQTRGVHAFDLPHSWETALPSKPEDSQPNVGVHIIKGPKNSGKSTFARTLMNNLLTWYQKVAYLECDLGQSEFSPGGMVTINIIDSPCFGPPFTHPTLPHFAHYIGATTPRSSPSHYLEAIQALLESYQLDIQVPIMPNISEDDTRISDMIPLVINTMGWNKGLGADLTAKIQDMANPTDVYKIEGPTRDTPWSALPTQNPHSTSPTAKLHSLQPIPTSVISTNYTATDHRSISILSYLHAIFPPSPSGELEQVTATSWDTSLPLCARFPYEVDGQKAFDRVILTGAGTEDVVPSEIQLVLNGAIVGLVTCDPGTLDVDVNLSGSTSQLGGNRVPYSQGFPVPSPVTSRCHGLALVRSMSPTSSQMHVLTPLPHHLLAMSKVVVKGEMELPVWGMLDFRGDGETVAGVEKGKVPYLQWGKGEGVGGDRRKVRRNLMRRGQT